MRVWFEDEQNRRSPSVWIRPNNSLTENSFTANDDQRESLINHYHLEIDVHWKLRGKFFSWLCENRSSAQRFSRYVISSKKFSILQIEVLAFTIFVFFKLCAIQYLALNRSTRFFSVFYAGLSLNSFLAHFQLSFVNNKKSFSVLKLIHSQFFKGNENKILSLVNKSSSIHKRALNKLLQSWEPIINGNLITRNP